MIKITHFIYLEEDGSKYVVIQTRIFGLLLIEKVIELESEEILEMHDN